MRREFGPTGQILLAGALGCAYLGFRGKGVRRVLLTNGELVERTRAIARKTGVSVNRVVVFSSPRNSANAFAHRMGTIMLSDRLLRVLSRQETDAVIAHETAHLRPGQRRVVKVLPATAAAIVTVLFLWPSALVVAPFLPFAALLLWRAMRRMQEFDADSNAIRVIQDPEALITALTRISRISQVPMDWGRLPGLFLSHPPMMARFRAIARRANISADRVDELVSLASITPPLAGYPLERLDPILTGASVVSPQTAGTA